MWNNMMMANLYGNFRTRTLSQIFPTYGEFETIFNDSPFAGSISEKGLKMTYYLLMAEYANSAIASSDEDRFVLQVCSLIFQYGPAWETKLKIQEKIKNLKEDEILRGSEATYNQAAHPGNEPSVSSDEIIQGIDNQTRQIYKKSKMEAYMIQYESVKDNMTKSYISRFKDLFLKIVQLELPLWYESED